MTFFNEKEDREIFDLCKLLRLILKSIVKLEEGLVLKKRAFKFNICDKF
jgi:hypothetical protein